MTYSVRIDAIGIDAANHAQLVALRRSADATLIDIATSRECHRSSGYSWAASSGGHLVSDRCDVAEPAPATRAFG